MTPAIKQAADALRKAQRHLASYAAPAERTAYLAEALRALGAEGAQPDPPRHHLEDQSTSRPTKPADPKLGVDPRGD